VPGTIARDIGSLVGESLAAHGIAAGDVRSWAVHPGGPRVLSSVQDSLALPPGSLDISHAVLAEHGNMSSATILFILERVFQSDAGPCVAMAFGPGLTAEFALLDRGPDPA